VKTWLFSTLHLEFGFCGKQARFSHLDLGETDVKLPSILAVAISCREMAPVLAALTQLGEIYQASIAPFYFQDYPYNEMAEILQILPGTMRSQLGLSIGRLPESFAGVQPRPGREQGHL
jgi:DNA-directed RNA polymerase specialized sigma24 family protein